MDENVYRHAGTIRPGGIVCVADHASNHVPAGMALGVDPGLMHEHIALDIGVEGVAEHLAARHGIPAHIATVSRLVCDFNRAEDDPAAVPQTSDGHAIPGNIGADITQRLDAYHRPYHDGLAAFVARAAPRLILALHSFTLALRSGGPARPWEVALLYNTDDRAARHAIRLFADEGFTVGDNEPYSGRDLNATMDRHAEGAGIPYLALEIRQDQIADAAGQALWADRIADVAHRVAALLSSS